MTDYVTVNGSGVDHFTWPKHFEKNHIEVKCALLRTIRTYTVAVRVRFSFNVEFNQTVHTMFSCTHAKYVSTYVYIIMIKLQLNLSIITSYNCHARHCVLMYKCWFNIGQH